MVGGRPSVPGWDPGAEGRDVRRKDDPPIPIPPDQDPPSPVEEPPDGPITDPGGPVREPEPEEPKRL